MTRRSLSAYFGAALVGSLGMANHAAAKPPDLPKNETITVQPKAAPEVEKNEGNTGSLIFGVGVNSNSGLSGSVYEALPTAIPTPALYELRPTARRMLVGSVLLGINPALSLLPIEKALDAPHDHPRRVAGEDVLSDIPKAPMDGIWSSRGHIIARGDWLKWLATHWAAQHHVPAPAQNEGYVYEIAYNEPAETPTKKCESPSNHAAELLPMPREVAATDGVTCPYLRQQQMDRHACQLADPQIGRDVLENLERLQQSDGLIELAQKLAHDGCLLEAMECCALAGDLCPGSPSADRAAGMMLDLCLGLREPAAATEEAAEDQEECPSGQCSTKRTIEQKLNQPVSLNFTNTPLRSVLDNLRATMGINIYVDEAALAEKGISPDSPLTIKLEQISCKCALKLLLHSVHLSYVIKDDILQITTEDRARGKLQQRVYKVEDLLVHKDFPKNSGIKSREGESCEKRLMDVITRTILPRSWSEMGGIGTIDYFPMTQALIVNQTLDVQDQIADLLAALRRAYDKEENEKEASLSEEKADGSVTEPGIEQQVNGLMKACRLLVNEGLHERAAELARQAYALDPQRVMADPLLYKMHLLANTPAKQPFGSTHPSGASEECEEPATCPYCPSIGKPIQGILPPKKESKSGPTTLLVPSLPPVDYEVVPALEWMLTEAAKPAGVEEASEPEASANLRDLIETMMDGIGVRANGSQMSCEWSCGGNIYHLRYQRGCLAVWKSPDAAKSKP